MRRGWKAGLLLAVWSLSLILSACGRPIMEQELPERPEEKTLVLWLPEDTPLTGSLLLLAERYREQDPDRKLELRLFPTEDQLLEAMREESPDLVLCSEGGMRRLGDGDLLRPLAFPAESVPRLFPAFETAAAGIGSGCYPLGASVPVLLLREDERALLNNCASVEDLCATASAFASSRGKPLFAVESYARFFAAAMAQKNAVFHAQPEADSQSEAYREIYNLLAGAAFDGGLRPQAASPVDAVKSGAIACAICSLQEFRNVDRKELAVLPVPPMAGCVNLTPADYWGIASVGTGKNTETVRFLCWLFTDDRAAYAVMGEGLLPSVDGDWVVDSGAFAEGLRRIARETRFFQIAGDADSVLYGAEFDRSFSEALARLL